MHQPLPQDQLLHRNVRKERQAFIQTVNVPRHHLNVQKELQETILTVANLNVQQVQLELILTVWNHNARKVQQEHIPIAKKCQRAIITPNLKFHSISSDLVVQIQKMITICIYNICESEVI